MEKNNRLLETSSVKNALDKVNQGLGKYLWIQENFVNINVQQNIEFQKRFNHFYKVRRDLIWRNTYFEILEKNKKNQISFGDTLQNLFMATGRFEPSFSSKLVATINPLMPVIDSVVMRNLGLKIPNINENRLQKTEELYENLTEKISYLITSKDGSNAIEMFKEKFPNARVTDVKIIDLILWQSR